MEELRSKCLWNMANVDVIKTELNGMIEEASQLTDRHLTRKKKHLDSKVAEKRVQIQRIDDGTEEREMENKLAPYLKAYAQNQAENIRLGSLDGFSKQTVDRKGTIVKEYLVEMNKAAPMCQIKSSDECPMCRGSMILVQVKALLCCNVCGYATPYLDSTSCNMSYNDDVDFASFSYKRINHVLPATRISPPPPTSPPPVFPYLPVFHCSSTSGCSKSKPKKRQSSRTTYWKTSS